MNYKTAKALLMYYPVLYRRIADRRELLLGSHVSSLANTGRHGTGGHADPTASKGVMLADLGETSKALDKVVAFMNTLTPLEREMILTVWRCGTCTDWKWVARHTGMCIGECRKKWNQMTRCFLAFAGAVSGPDGTACVGGRQSQSLG
ncbi:hypothetical protein [Desulfallas thermosapovorans]|uniref:Uncharacterized protein n=1 Tax=Desulfallas thermosapovorans DSM 6562 TaxID=1121431 RepID=A0A5S4ZW11_9FIRM|nr:hypothetical protein [Desulfallas thermosapovorans]TYO97038.1 hypothetical protein LX24_00851 [Desulfallas thermosapovorans DSM 6562]